MYIVDDLNVVEEQDRCKGGHETLVHDPRQYCVPQEKRPKDFVNLGFDPWVVDGYNLLVL